MDGATDVTSLKTLTKKICIIKNCVDQSEREQYSRVTFQKSPFKITTWNCNCETMTRNWTLIRVPLEAYVSGLFRHAFPSKFLVSDIRYD